MYVDKNFLSDKAEKYFRLGYNCSQSVVLAFADILPVDRDMLLALSSSFGGGMGRLREVCGAVSGIFIAAGILYGYSTPETGEVKAKHYELIQNLAAEFEERNGSIVCRELLGLTEKHSTTSPSERSEYFYTKRPCIKMIRSAVEIFCDVINAGQ